MFPFVIGTGDSFVHSEARGQERFKVEVLVGLKGSEGVVDGGMDFFGHDQLAVTPTRKISGTKGKRGFECLRAILTSIALFALRIQLTSRPEAML